MERRLASVARARAFTLLEVALIVAIIGMMLLMIIGYLMAPKAQGPLEPVKDSQPKLPSPTEPVPKLAPILNPSFLPKPAAATPVPAATPPLQTIEVSPAPALPPQTIEVTPSAGATPAPSFR